MPEHRFDRSCGQAFLIRANVLNFAKDVREMIKMTTCVFVQIRCKPGTGYAVADEIVLAEIHSELYSTSGEYDLLAKIYIPDGEDVGKYINDNLLQIKNIERTLTTLTFKAF